MLSYELLDLLQDDIARASYTGNAQSFHTSKPLYHRITGDDIGIEYTFYGGTDYLDVIDAIKDELDIQISYTYNGMHVTPDFIYTPDIDYKILVRLELSPDNWHTIQNVTQG